MTYLLQQSRYCSLTTHWPIFFRRRHFPSMRLSMSNFSRYDILFSWFFHTVGPWSLYVVRPFDPFNGKVPTYLTY